MTVTRQKIRTWINRQRTLPNPSPVYLAWLQKQYQLKCSAEVIKGKNKNGY
jgi:hypothetical protein